MKATNKLRIENISNSLHRGNTSSCGCLAESLLASELKTYFKKHYRAIPEYRILKNKETNRWLPYDIYIPDNIFIEVHGGQHYKFHKHFHKTKEEFEHNKKTDKMKRSYAKKNGLYIEVDLRKIKSTEEAIIYIENILGK